MIIDFHTHIFPPGIAEHRSEYCERDPLFRLLYSNIKAKLASAEDLIDKMDERGIDISVVLNIGWSSPELCHETNSYILEAVARFPGRLTGFGMLPFTSTEEALNELDYCAKNGMRGIGELRPGQDLLQNPESADMIFQTIKKHDLVLSMHTSEPLGHEYPGKGGITPEAVYPFISRFAGLKLVCAHWGGGLPVYALMPEVKKELASVYFDSAASPFLYSPGIYPQVISLAGSDRVLFGSDFPLLDPGRLLSQINELEIADEEKNRLMYKNALDLLGMK